MIWPVPIRTPEEGERFCALPGLSELTPEILDRHRPQASWAVARDDGTFAARCSLWFTEAPQLPGQRVGAIGHYAAADAEAAARILDFACDRLSAYGCTLTVGPMDGNTWRRYRLVTDRGTEPPFFLEPDNPEDWPVHFTGRGFTPLAEYYSAVNDDLSRTDPRHDAVARRVAERGIALRPLDLDRFDEELRAIHALSVASFTENFLYTQIGAEEFVEQYRGVRPYVRPELVLMAERDGELVGFLFAVPDLLQAKRGDAIDTVIIKTMAVHPAHRGSGIGGVLMEFGHRAAHRLGYRRAIHALMHADNVSRRISGHTARTIRRYTLFAKPLAEVP
jgi:GNAT superfamily N-acetyltransferase